MKFTKQIKNRRLSLGLKQADMKMRIGMNQQQYQKLEAGGNPRLDTLELIAEGLEAELMLVPKNQVRQVRKLLQESSSDSGADFEKQELSEDPWSGMLD